MFLELYYSMLSHISDAKQKILSLAEQTFRGVGGGREWREGVVTSIIFN